MVSWLRLLRRIWVYGLPDLSENENIQRLKKIAAGLMSMATPITGMSALSLHLTLVIGDLNHSSYSIAFHTL